MRKKSVSVLVSAYNEEDNIVDAVQSVKNALSGVCSDWEILVVDDGSTDTTGKISDELAQKDSRIVVIHHTKNRGLGDTFRAAVKQASKEYFTLFPGDNEMDWRSLRDLLQETTDTDIVFSYTMGPAKRPLYRRFFSVAFTVITNLLFGFHVKYYNGPFILRTALVKKIPLITKDFLIFAELKIRLLKSGARYKETPFQNIGRKHGTSKAFSLKNMIRSIRTLILLKQTLG